MNISRNDPCPCGSGLKFKKCCGAVIPLRTTATLANGHNKLVTAAVTKPQRECGTCTACCEGWAAGNIRGHEMRVGLHCHFLVDKQCTIYAERPVSPCRNFVCGWLADDSPFPEQFRPDQIGVIIIRIRWRDQPAYLLLNAGREPDAALIGWMEAYAMRTNRPFFYSLNGEKIGYGPVEFLQEMMARMARGEAMW